MSILFSSTDVPLGALLTCSQLNLTYKWDKKTEVPVSPTLSLSSSHLISRHLARLHQNTALYPEDLLLRCQIDHWLLLSSEFLGTTCSLSVLLDELNTALASSSYLVSSGLTIADFEMFSSLHKNKEWHQLMKDEKLCPGHVLRWYKHVFQKVSAALSCIPVNYLSPGTVMDNNCHQPKRETGGKFVDLPGAKMGQVVVRFPPEASGYLHIGHAKAALLNQHYQKAFKGKLIMRFDDTNPDKEKTDFEHVIIEDLKLLDIQPDIFSFTSDYFDKMLQLCEFLIKSGKAYVDDTDGDQMKKERDERKESKNRNNSPEVNMKMFDEMKHCSVLGQKCCVRAKIDMNSDNGCMRDPTIYRCKNEPHPRTGSKYKVYPTYDFACPIVDSLEGVTHALRTTEYHDRDEQFFWFIENLNLRSLHIYEYSRLNMNNTVLSKRKLTWFVDQGIVEGWDDPRFPTVRGIVRRGMTVEGLKDFILAQGSSRSVVNMEWDKIWSFNRKVIDRESSRYTALEGDLVQVQISGCQFESKQVQRHPKDTSKGYKTVWTGPKVWIEQNDAAELKEGTNATFINWGNIKISKIHRNPAGKIELVTAEANTEDVEYKKTLKVTWLAEAPEVSWTPVVCSYFGHLMSKSVLGKDEDFKQFVNHSTRHDVQMSGDHELKLLKAGDIIQIQRKGFFRVDEPYKPFSPVICKESPVCLFYIPDGHSKDSSLIPNGKISSDKNEEKLEMSGTTNPKSKFSTNDSITSIHQQIKSQGDKIRALKTDKSDKNIIMQEVEILKSLKLKFKEITKVEWTPDMDINKLCTPTKSKDKVSNRPSLLDLNEKIKTQGNKIREMKSKKDDKNIIKEAVDALLVLKKQFFDLSGKEWKPDQDTVSSSNNSNNLVSANTVTSLHDKIKEQGDKIRSFKSAKSDKNLIKCEVDILLSLKKDFNNLTGVDWQPDIDISQFVTKNVSQILQTQPSSNSEEKNVDDLFYDVKNQADLVRSMKSSNSDKESVKIQVNRLLDLKTKFKNLTNLDWKNDLDLSSLQCGKMVSQSSVSSGCAIAEALHKKIKDQGDIVRNLKTQKASKESITEQVNILLELKKQFKEQTNIEWKPDIDLSSVVKGAVSQSMVTSGCTVAEDLSKKIKDQGDIVRNLKAQKASKESITEQVNILLELKKQFKEQTNIEWKPDIDISSLVKGAVSQSMVTSGCTIAEALHKKIKDQGDIVRNLKAQKASKESITEQVNVLLELKKQFKEQTNIEWKPDIDLSALVEGTTRSKPTVDGVRSKITKSAKEAQPSKVESAGAGKKQTRLCLEAKKLENLADWYSQVITKSEMIEYYNVSGCYILRPWSYAIWEFIKDFLDKEIKKLGVENGYFPIFVSKEALEKEKSHLVDFSPEVAWVTRSGSSEMAEPVAIRPTSETVMYPAFAKWIQSHRDLPIKINQWNNVVRWEFKQPTPFLRTREFLWQEGHTAFATKEEAHEEVYAIAELYARVYQELLAIPVIKGKKTEKEKFAGSDFSITTETFISASGRGIQGATSHHLGQNFSKMVDIVFDDPKTKEKSYVYQNSWGLTTRTIGVMVMVHGDDKGLVLPPVVAPIQVVIMPVGITASTTTELKDDLANYCSDISKTLNDKGIRTKCDFKDNVTPAWKFNHWELKGVPLRIEIGPRELSDKKVYAVRRDNGAKESLDSLFIDRRVFRLLEEIQFDMFNRAKNDFDSHVVKVTCWDDFLSCLNGGNVLLAPYCGDESCEDEIKKNSTRDDVIEPGAPSMGAKTLCIPFEQPGTVDGLKCIYPSCSSSPKFFTLFGRSY